MSSLLGQIETVPVGSLEFYPGNARIGNVPVIAESLRENEQYAPLVVQRSTRHVLAGNHTLKAARSLGWDDIDVVFVDVDDHHARKIVLSSNRTADLASYDDDALVELLSYLDEDYEGTGWTAEDVEALITPPEDFGGGSGDPDDVPEPPAEAVSAFGDLYLLGPHRLLCGDAADLAAHDRLLAGQRPDVLLMDPPYGMRLDTDFSTIKGSLRSTDRAQGTQGNKYAPVIGDHDDYDPQQILGLYDDVPEQFWWGADYYAERIPHRADGSWLVWDKRKESQAEAIGSEFELCWSRVKHKRRMLRHEWFGFLSSESPDEARNRVHPTQKPVALYVDILTQWGREGNLVLDTYGGSGTTVLACHRLGMRAAVMEMSEPYVDVICARWERATGIKPERVLSDGTTEPISFLDEADSDGRASSHRVCEDA